MSPDQQRYGGTYGPLQWGWDRLVTQDGHIDPHGQPGVSGYWQSVRPPDIWRPSSVVWVPPKNPQVPLYLILGTYVAFSGVQRPAYAQHPYLQRGTGATLDALEQLAAGDPVRLQAVLDELLARGLIGRVELQGVQVFVLPVWLADPAPVLKSGRCDREPGIRS